MKKYVLLLICCILLVSMVGCSKSPEEEYPVYNADAEISYVPTGTVASNDTYELLWDDTAYSVMLKDRQTGKIWSNIPYEYQLEGGTSANVNSTINLTCMSNENLSWDSYRGYSDAVEDGKVSCEKVDNGVRVTYYFDRIQVSVPVVYTLGEKSLDVMVDVQNISEGSVYKVVSVSVAPFLCSANNENEGSYVVVPSGSGALMYANETIKGTRKYTGNIYGDDISRLYTEVLNDSEPIRLPVFGVKNGDDALLCIMKDGAESALIEAEAGNKRTGYTTVYPTYYVRGYDSLPTSFANQRIFGGGNSYNVVSSARSNVNPTLSYFPLAGEDADYNGMAKCYRNYLETTGALVKTNAGNSYGLTIIGGAQVTDSILGIPCDSTVAATTFAQAQEILTGLSDAGSIKPTVRLLGFGDRGINPGKLAGGFSFLSLYGSKAQRLDLETYCKEQGISLFTDFDLVRFSRSGNGISTLSSAAKTASLRKTECYPYGTPQREYLKNYDYSLLIRNKLPSVVDKLLGMADKQSVSGIGLTTLGHLAYSDFSSADYAAMNNTQNTVSAAIKTLLDGGHSVAGGPNSYSAISSSVVFDVPTDHGGNFALDAEIPFYQLVFRGSKPIYGESINLAEDMNRTLLKTLAYGADLSFSVLYEYDTDFTETDMVYPGMGANKLYACDFSANVTRIRETLSKYSDLYAKIGNANMVRYTAISDTVTETVFDNGVTLYVNHGEAAAESPVGELAGFSVRY